MGSVDDQLAAAVYKIKRRPANRTCFECGERGPQAVVLDFSIFVCMACSGIHREFSHRVKGISTSSFTAQEVAAIEAGGNDVADQIWRPHFQGRESLTTDLKHNISPRLREDRVRQLIRQTYRDQVWRAKKKDRREDKKKKNKKKRKKEKKKRRISRQSSSDLSPEISDTENGRDETPSWRKLIEVLPQAESLVVTRSASPTSTHSDGPLPIQKEHNNSKANQPQPNTVESVDLLGLFGSDDSAKAQPQTQDVHPSSAAFQFDDSDDDDSSDWSSFQTSSSASRSLPSPQDPFDKLMANVAQKQQSATHQTSPIPPSSFTPSNLFMSSSSSFSDPQPPLLNPPRAADPSDPFEALMQPSSTQPPLPPLPQFNGASSDTQPPVHHLNPNAMPPEQMQMAFYQAQMYYHQMMLAQNPQGQAPNYAQAVPNMPYLPPAGQTKPAADNHSNAFDDLL